MPYCCTTPVAARQIRLPLGVFEQPLSTYGRPR
jgi:hypothetical protein